MPIPSEVFLSHSSKDRRFARKIAGVLRDHGVPAWYSETNIMGAQQWHDEIGLALRRCDWFLVLLSPPALSSKWVKREVLSAFQKDQYNDHIIPLLYKDCDYASVLWPLEAIQHIDFKANHKEAYRKLLRIWGLGYKPAK